MNFFDQLAARAHQANSLLCVGLDPRAESIASLREQCYRLIDATAEYAIAFKPNTAFFEVWGAEGWTVLRDVIAHVPADIPVILDAKRGDIADTAEAYARAIFDSLGAHAVTLSPYLGGDSIQPFIARPERGAFILCKTSNPGADEFQALEISGRPLYEIVAERVKEWNTSGNLGLVVGATDSNALRRVRAIAPGLWFLVPGVGAQGGSLEQTLSAGLRDDGMGLVVNISRAIAQAENPREQARHWRDEINRWRAARETKTVASPVSELASDLITTSCVRFGEFKLKSGIVSPIYLDLRRLISHPHAMRRVARTYAEVLNRVSFDRLAGIPYAGLPIATAVALEMNRPLIYARREVKEYGTRAAIEGEFAPGETIAVIDDLATTGDTKIEAIQKLTDADLTVRDIVVLIDREQGARALLQEHGYRLHAVAALSQLLDEWQRSKAITPEQFAEVKAFLSTQAS